MNKKRVLVVGLGPSGGILAAHLSSAGYMVYGVDVWKNHVEEISRNGISIRNLISLHTPLEKVASHPDGLGEDRFDYVAIAVKIPHMPGLIPWLKNLHGDFRILLLQNGLDNEECLKEHFEPKRILRVAVNYAGYVTSPGTIKMTFFQKPNQVGNIGFNHVCEYTDEIAGMMTRSSLDTDATDDIRKALWRKLILNAILAPIAAIRGVTMADVIANTCTRTIVQSLLREAIEVAKADGYDYGDDFYDKCMGFLYKAGRHKPSMLIDIENGNPTEIDYINGRIVHYGEKYNIPVFFNSTLTERVKARERQNIQPAN